MAGLPALVTGSPSRAETTRTFPVSATIQPGCAIDGLGTSGNAGLMGTLTFAPQPSVATATVQTSLAATQTVTLRCTPGVQLTMSVNGGQHSASGGRNLQLGSTAARLVYALCADAGCSQSIGIDQTMQVSVTSANMNSVQLPIYGRLTLPGNTPSGTYADTLTVTLSW